MNQFTDVAPVVGRRYRLRPEDLLGGSIETKITNVSVEGVEVLRPVVHFDRLNKPLVVNPETANDLAYVTRSAIPQQWIGHNVTVASVEQDGALRLTILSPTASVPKPVRLTRRSTRARQQRTRSLLIALMVLLIFLAVYVLDNSTLMADFLELIFGA